MRGPTVNELRLLDRNLHATVLKEESGGGTTLEAGLTWYADTNRGHAL